MQQIIINWPRLFRYSLLFIVFSMLVTIFMHIWFSASLEDAWNNGVNFSMAQLTMSFELSLTLFIFIAFPVLLFRFILFFSKMIYRGRKPDVAMLNFKTLFNPLNFLLFPSLLNPVGRDYRRRCLISLILLISLYLLMILLIN
ncbi:MULTISPECIES: hypothetical protein [Colwellia]|uniref:Uncharacterized protein n=1 Tax=Colwellia marinimaniae TaxID=1513592 RepID=A0ABQ0MZ83_9GAMM|nr:MULTISPECIES: hypothetical protein [Colwellia]GAW97681.1 hypothetical protein MTCD1_03321 [Colwellia marinimaniae]